MAKIMVRARARLLEEVLKINYGIAISEEVSNSTLRYTVSRKSQSCNLKTYK
jgi:hypothetical protein